SPPEEARALWISRWDWTGESELRALLEDAAGANFNIVYFQVRGRGDAYYQSALEPWAHRPPAFELGRDPGWDPLAVALAVARAEGLELHAWINALIGWCGAEPIPETTPRHILLEHPSWAMVDQEGGTTAENCTWLTPGEPGVRSRVAAVAADLLRGYQVDGVHLDYIRYPGPAFSYDATSLASYEAARAAEPGLEYDEFRRGLVSETVREVRDSVRAARPGARLSAAVWGIHSDVGWSGVTLGYETRFQDSWAWTDAGIIDAIVPMIYWSIKPVYGDRLDFGFLADRHASRVTARHVYIGMGVDDSGSTFCTGCDVVRQIYRARLAGGHGVSVFSGRLVASRQLWDDLRDGPFEQPVPVPSMPWITSP
ncbi:MAG: family 10 glycosylhydrolase, partial [Gemmatimonadetes bacterium]|nr:family 10 glycosylhydrolase [Gemmatimonadota bacterium]